MSVLPKQQKCCPACTIQDRDLQQTTLSLSQIPIETIVSCLGWQLLVEIPEIAYISLQLKRLVAKTEILLSLDQSST